MADETFRLFVEGFTASERDQLADELLKTLKRSASQIVAERKNSGFGSQDAGTLIQLVLNGAAVVAVAKGLADWLRLRQGAEVTVERHDGTKVVIKKVSGKMALSAIEAALGKADEGA